MEDETILSMENITKSFGSVTVLRDVSLDLRRGEVLSLIGANGAGKSTLMKVLNGIYASYSGRVLIEGKPVNYQSPQEAQRAGISMIHQELDLAGNLDVAANVYLGRELKTRGLLDRGAMRRKTQELLDSLNFDVDARAPVSTLSPAQQQLVLIARSVSVDARIIVMDEPTSSLSFKETENLYKVIEDLKRTGKSIIYISHFLDEIFRVSDRVSVLRDGRNVVTKPCAECTTQQLVEWMIGDVKNFGKRYVRKNRYEDLTLEVNNYTQRRGIVNDVTFQLRKGEVLAIAGVVGSGRTELAKMIFGAEERASGTMKLEGKSVRLNSPSESVRREIALVPEERKKEGLILKRSIGDNISIIAYKNCLSAAFINYHAANKQVEEMIKYLGIVCESKDKPITSLSGGNQQKVVMARWLSVRPKVLVLDQPTRGVDVGAKSDMYELINELAEQGTSIILITDELDEILNLSDRVLIMRKGKLTAEFSNNGSELTKADLLEAMVG